MDDKRYGYFRSGEVLSMERRQYTPVGLTTASMRPIENVGWAEHGEAQRRRLLPLTA